MTADFHLYVGSDLIVQALSERYLKSEDQATRNALRMIVAAGGTLVLAEPVLEEVHTHIASTALEFQNKYRRLEPDVRAEFIFRNSDRILIRAYYYSRHSPPDGVRGPNSWSQYIDQFCSFQTLHTQTGREQLKNYLTAQFGLIYESRPEIEELTEESRVAALTEKLATYKKSHLVARNDALVALAVYGRRRKRHEHSKTSQFGYRTWWLTGESRILLHTKEIVAKQGAQFLMRPEFILRFLAIAPSAAEVRKSYATIFPSHLGVRLARRVSAKELEDVLSKVKESDEMEDGRRLAKISELSDQLKTRFFSSSVEK